MALAVLYKPSSALPFIAQRVAGYRDAMKASLLAPLRGDAGFTRAVPRSSVAVRDVHSLLTTPKDVPLSTGQAATAFAPLMIRTEVRSHRVISHVQPLVSFSQGLSPGSRRIVHSGRPGIAVVTERVTLWNDLVVDRQVMSRMVVQRAQPSIIVAAPRSLAEALAVAGVRKPVAVYAMVATAYTADSAQAVPTGITATGLPAHYGVVAVDPRVIRLGSRLFIEGYGAAIAADTGGAIRGNRIDLCMDSLRSALNWGRQPVKVYVLQE